MSETFKAISVRTLAGERRVIVPANETFDETATTVWMRLMTSQRRLVDFALPDGARAVVRPRQSRVIKEEATSEAHAMVLADVHGMSDTYWTRLAREASLLNPEKVPDA